MSFEALNLIRKEVERGAVCERAVGNLSLFEYSHTCMFDNLWNDVVRRCRGIVFDTTKGKIVSRPFDKFFNINEKEETQTKALLKKAKTISFSCTDKMDGCFDKQTLIMFCDGSSHRIKDIVEQKMSGPIWGYDHKLQKLVPTKIVAWHDKGKTDDWLTISIIDKVKGNRRTLRCTPNHEVYTHRGYQRADTLRRGDIIYQIGSQLNKVQRSIVLGSLMGDMSISKQSWHPIEWCHGIAQEDLSQLIIKVMNPLYASTYTIPGGSGRNWAKKDVVQHVICGDGTFDEFFSLCINKKTGKKTITNKWLRQIDPIALAMWYMDDGSMMDTGLQRPRVQFSTEGYNKKEQSLIIHMLKQKFGIRAIRQIVHKNKDYWCLRLNADDAEKLWTIIAPYIIPTLQYKIPSEYRKIKTFWDTYNFSSTEEGMHPVKVIGIKKGNILIDCPASTCNRTGSYDLTTTTANYIADKMLVHNSMISFWHHNNQWHTNTPGSIESPQAQYARDKLLPKYKLDGLPKDLSYVCELITPWDGKNKVVKYGDKDDLVMITAFENKWDQVEVPKGRVDMLAAQAGIERIKEIPMTIEDFLSYHIQDGLEGYVIHFFDGFRVKVKSHWYVKWHRVLNFLTEKNVMELLRDGSYKDLVKEMPESLRSGFDDVASILLTMKEQITAEVDRWWGITPDPSDFKRCAELFKQAGDIQSVLFARMRGNKDFEHKATWKVIQRKLEEKK